MVTNIGDAAGSFASGSAKKGIDWKAWDMRVLIIGGYRLGCMLLLLVIACHRL